MAIKDICDKYVTGQTVRTPRGVFHETKVTKSEAETYGYGIHHYSDDGQYAIIGNGTRAFAVDVEFYKKGEPRDCTKMFRVYGADGHRQKESFCRSAIYDFSEVGDVRVIVVRNADITGTHDYSEVWITRNKEQECWDEIRGQVSDGIFENCNCGAVVEVDARGNVVTAEICEHKAMEEEEFEDLSEDEDW